MACLAAGRTCRGSAGVWVQKGFGVGKFVKLAITEGLFIVLKRDLQIDVILDVNDDKADTITVSCSDLPTTQITLPCEDAHLPGQSFKEPLVTLQLIHTFLSCAPHVGHGLVSGQGYDIGCHDSDLHQQARGQMQGEHLLNAMRCYGAVHNRDMLLPCL